MLILLPLVLLQPPASAPVTPAVDWRSAEAPFLADHVQLTFPDRFARAGEAYFDHQNPPRYVIFQAIERPEKDKPADTNYAMYVAALKYDRAAVVGIEAPRLISTPASANTCGWFNPIHPEIVTFGSTLTKPQNTDSPGYSRDRQRYSWQFPTEMELVSARIDRHDEPARPVFSRPGYDAEGSFSKDGRFFLYTHVDTTNNDPNLWIFDTKSSKHYPIVTTRGYDGGPFFSPDGKWICYRSDRKGNNVLQLYIGELAFGDDGDTAVPIGLNREIQLTTDLPGVDDANQPVSWCPYWSHDGKYLVYASSAAGGHQNYEVLAMEVAPIMQPGAAIKPTDLRRARITNAPGFDGLPVFSDDGRLMMWTSQRGPKAEGEQRPSSQLWIATTHGEPAWGFTPPPAAPASPAPPASTPPSSTSQ